MVEVLGELVGPACMEWVPVVDMRLVLYLGLRGVGRHEWAQRVWSHAMAPHHLVVVAGGGAELVVSDQVL